MTSQAIRRAGIPLAVALLVLAVVLGVARLADQPDGVTAGSGGATSSPGGGADGTTGSTPSVVPPEPAPGTGTEPGGERMSRFVSVTRGSADTTLDVRFWGGVETCYEYTVRADEGRRDIRLTLDERSRSAGPCIELAQQYDRTVHLREPLGDRRVVDAETGETLLEPTTR